MSLVLLTLASDGLSADFPSWWTKRGVLKLDGANQRAALDDDAAISQRLLEDLVHAARHELQGRLPGGAGPLINSMISAFDSRNLAIQPIASAMQSSTVIDAMANRARDNNTNGEFWSGLSVTHTDLEENPWWQIDLQFSAPIENVETWNRTDCCGERTANFYVFISDTDMSESSLADLLTDTNIWRSEKITSPPNPSSTISVGGIRGRFVMIRTEGEQYLHLAEVKVRPVVDDDAEVTFGQLKAMALPFRQRLGELVLDVVFPWLEPDPSDDSTVADIGQAKQLFSFDFTDTDGDGLIDAWEKHYGLDPNDPADALVDGDSDGLTNAEEYRLGTDPSDYNSGSPSIRVVSGNGQMGNPGEWNRPFSLLVKDQLGRPLAGAPVTIAISRGGGTVSSSSGGPETETLQLVSGPGGTLVFHSKLPETEMTTQRISVSTGTSSASVTTSTQTTGGAAAPTNVRLTRSEELSLTLSWTDNSTNETAFRIYRKTPDTEWELIAELPPDSTSYIDTNVVMGETYTYVVDAR